MIVTAAMIKIDKFPFCLNEWKNLVGSRNGDKADVDNSSGDGGDGDDGGDDDNDDDVDEP